MLTYHIIDLRVLMNCIKMIFDVVITVYDQIKETCPFFPSKKGELHKSFDDPSKFEGTEEKMLVYFRFIRNQIKDWIDEKVGKSKQACTSIVI